MNNQKKKVLLIITKSNFGGAQKYVFELAKDLKRRGFFVQVALGGEGLLIKKLKEAQIEVIQISHLKRDVSFVDDIRTFFTLVKILKKNKPDIVHLNSSKIGGIGALASRICFVPKTIFTIHGWAFNEDRGFGSKLIIKFLYFITILLSNTSIAVSNITKKQASSIPFSFLIKNKIRVIHNGIETPVFLLKEESVKFFSSKLGINLENKILIGQIAELHPIKSIETTIHAMKKIVANNPQIIFLIIGEGQERTGLENLIRTLKLESNVFLLGFVDNAAQYLKAFDLFCLTSKSEALALVLIETGLAHVPIIASRVGGIPEIIIDNETGFLFESGDENQLTIKIQHTLSLSQDEKERITNALFNKIQKNFLIEHMTEEIITLYS